MPLISWKGGKNDDLKEEFLLQGSLMVIVCSEYSVVGPAREVIDAGAQDFIQKPFTMADLSEKLKEILEGKQSSSNY
jgi:FixJ family two-component response regulator